jgi:predicted nucleic acid-binding protein
MNAVFLDTVGLIAVWDATDQWHPAAEAAYQKLLSQGRPLVTTEMVLLECGNAAARRPYRPRVNALRRVLIEGRLLVVPKPEEVEAAWVAYDTSAAGGAGIVDHLSFQVMRRLGLNEAFTNDQHFQAAGFTTLLLSSGK